MSCFTEHARRFTLAVLVAGCAFGAVGSPASGAGCAQVVGGKEVPTGLCRPWWHLLSGSTYLQPGQAADEVQRLTTPPSVKPGETYRLFGSGTGLYKRNGSRAELELELGESAEKVQKALEGAYGEHNIEVTGGPEVYEVKFVGELTDMPVAPMELTGPEYGQGQLEPIKVTEVVKGRTDGEIVVTAVNLGDANTNPETQPVTIADKLPLGCSRSRSKGVSLKTCLRSAFPLRLHVRWGR